MSTDVYSSRGFLPLLLFLFIIGEDCDGTKRSGEKRLTLFILKILVA